MGCSILLHCSVCVCGWTVIVLDIVLSYHLCIRSLLTSSPTSPLYSQTRACSPALITFFWIWNLSWTLVLVQGSGTPSWSWSVQLIRQCQKPLKLCHSPGQHRWKEYCYIQCHQAVLGLLWCSSILMAFGVVPWTLVWKQTLYCASLAWKQSNTSRSVSSPIRMLSCSSEQTTAVLTLRTLHLRLPDALCSNLSVSKRMNRCSFSLLQRN